MADLTTTAAVKAFTGTTLSASDAVIADIVSGVSAMLASKLRHDWEPGSITGELHSAAASGALVLSKRAVSVEAVRVNGSALASGDFRLRGRRLVDRIASGVPTDWSQGSHHIEVDYTPETVVPDDVELAARIAAVFVLKQSGTQAGAGRLGLGAQANSDVGTADYFIHKIDELPIVRDLVRSYALLS